MKTRYGSTFETATYTVTEEMGFDTWGSTKSWVCFIHVLILVARDYTKVKSERIVGQRIKTLT